MAERKKSYAELLKDPRWQKKRLEILERDHWACFRCDDKETTLHVHHKYYERGFMPWEYPDAAYVTLCERCHEHVEFVMDAIKKAMALVWIDDLETILGYIVGRRMTWLSGDERGIPDE